MRKMSEPGHHRLTWASVLLWCASTLWEMPGSTVKSLRKWASKRQSFSDLMQDSWITRSTRQSKGEIDWELNETATWMTFETDWWVIISWLVSHHFHLMILQWSMPLHRTPPRTSSWNSWFCLELIHCLCRNWLSQMSVAQMTGHTLKSAAVQQWQASENWLLCSLLLLFFASLIPCQSFASLLSPSLHQRLWKWTRTSGDPEMNLWI